VRGVIDLVLDEPAQTLAIAAEAHSDVRRAEQQVRWANAKADSLAQARAVDGVTPTVSRSLLLRSAQHTRSVVASAPDVVASAPDVVAAARPSRTSDAFAALTGTRPWPCAALLWCGIPSGSARMLPEPPRGIAIGR